jgi:hypothetical protein
MHKTFISLMSIFVMFALGGCQKTFESGWNDVTQAFRLDSKSSDVSMLSNKERQDAKIEIDYCPAVEIVDELSSLSEFLDGTSEADLVTRANINQVESACAYRGGALVVDLRLSFTGILGAQAKKESSDKSFFAYPFFVAVLDKNGEVLAKEVFAASMTFPPAQNEHIYIETLRQLIPADSLKDGPDYKIKLGFQLTSDQLKYNRRNMVRAPKNIVSVQPTQSQIPVVPAPAAPPSPISAEKLEPEKKSSAPVKLAPAAR